MNPQEQAAVEFFIRQSMATARRMPLLEARTYLHGLLISFPEGSTEISEVLRAYHALCASDDALTQIAGGQMKLFPEEGR
jgi:hypothetical protein